MNLKTFLLAASLLGLFACGGGGGGSAQASGSSTPNQGFAGPSNLRISLDGTPGEFIITWTPPTVSFDGYNLEGQVGSDPFKQLNTSLIPSNTTSLVLQFTDTAPEETTFIFRMNAMAGAQASAYSNTASVTSGLHAPGQPTGQFSWDLMGITLSWLRNSTANTTILLERATTDVYGNPIGSWVPIPVPDPLSGSALDSTVSMGMYYIYRVTNLKGSDVSIPGPASTPIYTGLPAPSQPTATFDFANSAMSVAWQRNTTFNDGVRLERAETNGGGTTLGSWIQIDLSNSSTSIYSDHTVDLNRYYIYRVTNVRTSTTSATSLPSQPVFAGLQPAVYLSANWDNAKAGMNVSWAGFGTNDSWILERVPCDATGTPQGNWSDLATLPKLAIGFLDLATQEAVAYRYRVTAASGTTRSLPYLSDVVVAPLTPPTGLAATTTAAGIQLTWQNHSSAANQVIIRRLPNPNFTTDIAILAANASSYLDPVTSLGYFTYIVVAKNGNQESSGNAATAATNNPPGSLVLTATAVNTPSPSDAALRPSGAWAFSSKMPFGILSNNDLWPANFPASVSRSGSPILQVDKQGWPHTIYAVPTGNTPTETNLIHTWFDGKSWASEIIITAVIPSTSDNPGWAFRLDSSGSPHLLVDHVTSVLPYGGSTSSLSYVHKLGGAWTEEPLSVIKPAFDAIGSYHLVLDGSDTPHLLIGNGPSLADCVRTGLGTWAASTLPVANANAGAYAFLDGIWFDRDNGWVFYECFTGGNLIQPALSVIEKMGGQWQLPIVLGSRVFDGASTTAMAASSQDNTRVAVLFNTSAGIKAYHLAADGWHETLVAAPGASYPFLRLGFDASEKIHILSSTLTNTTDYHE